MPKDIEVAEKGGQLEVPAVPSMFDEVTISDVKLPLILIQEPLSTLVKEGITRPGDVVLAASSDDTAAQFLIGGPDKRDHFVAYILGRQRFAATTVDGRVVHHPTPHRDPNDPESWEGWYFDVAIPEFDNVLPARWRLWKTAGRGAAQSINTMLERHGRAGNTDPLAVKVTLGTRTNRAGQSFFVPRIAPGEINDDHLETAKELQVMAHALRAARAQENSAPEPSEQPSFS